MGVWPNDGLLFRFRKGGRKVRTDEHRVSCESKRVGRRKVVNNSRATVTIRVAPCETTKLLGTVFPVKEGAVAILPAATDELHLNRDVPYRLQNQGDKAAGIREIIVRTESGLRATHNLLE